MAVPGTLRNLRRFYAPPERIREDRALLTGADARHCRVTLRMKPGHRLAVLDGKGNVYEGEIEAFSKEGVRIRLLSKYPAAADPVLELTLAQAMIRKEPMKWILQKATELGVTNIVPFRSSRCVRFRPEAGDAWMERARRILIEAAKQCGRSAIPDLGPAVDFKEFIRTRPAGEARLLLWENGEILLSEAIRSLSPPDRIVVAVGPEGGFTPQEARAAQEHGFRIAGLGNRILRSETAALAVLSIIQYEKGDLGAPAKDRSIQPPRTGGMP